MSEINDITQNPQFAELEKLKRKQVFNILVIDDDKIILELFRRYLESWGFNVLTAQDPYQGVSLAVSSNPVLILLDVYLPEMSGDKILKLLKSIDITSRIPVIIVSGNLSLDLLNSTYKEGATGFLSKPFTKEDLYNNVISAINPQAAKNSANT